MCLRLCGEGGLSHEFRRGRGRSARSSTVLAGSRPMRRGRSGVVSLWSGPNRQGRWRPRVRVGRADERATHSGITHLVEHLALPRQAPPGVEFNGFVSGSLTSLWASGDKQQSLALLRDAAALLSNLPDRVATERRILLTEESGRGHGVIAAAAAARFGPNGEGLIASVSSVFAGSSWRMPPLGRPSDSTCRTLPSG